MNGALGTIIQITTLLVAPILTIGLINRTKAIWAGRKGPRLNQFFFDLRRLFQKIPVYSEVSSWIFRLAPWLVLTTSLAAGLLVCGCLIVCKMQKCPAFCVKRMR